jgi:hypothetical protein
LDEDIKKMKFVTTLFVICISAFAFSAMSSVIKINAGTKIISFNTTDIEWDDFCLGNNFGCARYKTINTSGTKPDFGFIKILSDKILSPNFSKYCNDTFNELKVLDKSLTNFSESSEKSFSLCSWKSKEETTFMIWKDGISLLISTSEATPRPRVISLMSQAKFYERP